MAADRDEYILESLRQAMPMLQNIASRYNVDVEDLRQASAVNALIWYERACKAPAPRAYLHRVIRNAAIDYVKDYGVSPISLDAPFSEDDDATLGEMVPARQDDHQDYTDVDAHCAILHKALRRLPLEEQAYMRQVHQLNAFNPVLPRQADGSYRKPNYNRSRSTMSQCAYNRLRADQELAQALGFA